MDEKSPHKWFTAGEAAAIAKAKNVAGVPVTESGMIKWIKRCGPEEVSHFSRKRTGQKGGGGTEYYWCFFQEALWDALDTEVERRNTLAPYRPPAAVETPRERYMRYKHRRGLPPDLSAPQGMLAEMLVAAAGLEQAPATFHPFVIRKVQRCRIRVANKKYFSLALTPFHHKEVCVTTTDNTPDLLWVLVFEQPRYSKPAPGRFICVADANAGKARYVSAEFQEMAEAKRAAGFDRRRLMLR